MAKKDKIQREEVSTYGHFKDENGNIYFKKERKIFNKGYKPSLFNPWPEPDEVIEEFWVESVDGNVRVVTPYSVELPTPSILFTEKHEIVDRDIKKTKRGNFALLNMINLWVCAVLAVLVFFSLIVEIIIDIAK